MARTQPIHIVGCHCAGEVCDVIVRGVLNPPGCTTMYEKLVYFRDKEDHIQQLLLQEPRGRPAMCLNLALSPCDRKADYPPMFGGSTIATAAVLLETGMLKMTEPGGRCKAVAFDNVPSFVFALDYEVDIPGLGSVSVDIAWETPSIKCVSILEFTEPLDREKMEAVNTVAGRFDQCPCGTGSCAQMAILHARGQLAFRVPYRGTERLGGYDAICRRSKGIAYIYANKQMVLDPADFWSVGFRVGDQWHVGYD
ncbi:hypothetical protein BDW68DRAFT_188094 [Aspergillus falconensis]